MAKKAPSQFFMKFTAHQLKKNFKQAGTLEMYSVKAVNKLFKFWQRYSLGIETWSREVARQKLEYIHGNPVFPKWLLAKDHTSYHYSSARFYEHGVEEFGFLNNLYTLFDGD